jgi:putative ABC transport system permease protein
MNMRTFIQDLRYGARMLLKHPGFTLIAVFTLALGIGATTAIFSAVNPVLFEPLPYPRASSIMTIWYVGADGSRVEQAFGTYREVAQRNHSFDAIAVMKPWQPTMTSAAAEPERLTGQRVSASYFQVLGVKPFLGQDFDSSEDRVNGPNVAIISNELWLRRFGGDQAIVGRQFTLDDKIYNVIGVMPRDFDNVLSPATQIWSPLQYDMSLGTAWGHHLRMIGRLRPGLGLEEAKHELDSIAHTAITDFPRVPWASIAQGFIVNPLQDDVTAGVRPALLAVFGAVTLLLGIASINVTNLLLARGAQRRAEFAVRAALGASRTRMVRQMLTESLLLALLGGAAGMSLANLGVRALVALSPPGLPRVNAIVVNYTVLGFTLGITTLIGLIVGLVPAVYASRNDLQTSLKLSSSRTAAAHNRARSGLVVMEVALALVLLVGGGLLMRSLQRLFAISPGFDTAGLLTMQVQTLGRRFDQATNDRFFAQALEAVRRTPGVRAAAFTNQLPLSGDDDEYGARFEGDDPNLGYNVFRYAVSPGYFETIGVPLRRGRLINENDNANAPPILLISESLAKRKFGDRDPIGKRLHVGPIDRPWYTIIGVVGDVKQVSLAVNQPDAVYIPTTQSWDVEGTQSLIVRAVNADGLTSVIKKAIWSANKDQPIVRIATMDSLLRASAGERRFALVLFEAFGFVALALAAIGVYGVLASSVAERTREIGIRLALGAQKSSVLHLVLRQGLMLTLGGVSLGLLAAWALTPLLLKLLYGVTPTDPFTFAAVALLLIAVALVACYIPARRVTKVDPLVALRYE